MMGNKKKIGKTAKQIIIIWFTQETTNIEVVCSVESDVLSRFKLHCTHVLHIKNIHEYFKSSTEIKISHKKKIAPKIFQVSLMTL